MKTNKKKVVLRCKVILLDVNITPNENLRLLIIRLRRIYLRIRFVYMLIKKKIIRVKNKILRFIGKANAIFANDIYMLTLFILSFFGL